MDKDNIEGLASDFDDIGFNLVDADIDESKSGGFEGAVKDRRRAFASSSRRGRSDLLNIVEGPDGILRFNTQSAGRRNPSNRRAVRAALPPGKIKAQFAFDKLQGTNQISKKVRRFDIKCTGEDKLGFWALDDSLDFSKKVSDSESFSASAKARILIFVHGTFSHGDTTCSEIKAAKSNAHGQYGEEFLRDAKKHYDLVINFNHLTLSVSPMVNAFRLAAEIRDLPFKPKEIDIICHSRGGVVTRWWLEGFAAQDKKYRVVFLGSPLAGTSLASPTNLRAGMNVIANYSKVISKGAKQIGNPLTVVAGGVFSIVSMIAGAASKTPVFDAACAVFPGLMGQARTDTNFELSNLRASGGYAHHMAQYYAVTSNFEPGLIDKWKFWHILINRKDYLMTIGEGFADKLIFQEQDSKGRSVSIPNDIVVDTHSMSDLADSDENDSIRIPKANRLDFGTNGTVHHTNYVSQFKVLEFIRGTFGF